MINSAAIKDFHQYVYDFYTDMYPEHKFTMSEIVNATKQYLNDPDTEFAADSVDRENIRDIIFNLRKTELLETDTYSPFHTVNN